MKRPDEYYETTDVRRRLEIDSELLQARIKRDRERELRRRARLRRLTFGLLGR